MTLYKRFDKSDMSSAFGWEGTVYPFVIVTDDAMLSLSLSTANIIYQQIMYHFLLHIHNNRNTIMFNFFNICKCLAYLWTFAVFEVNVLTTYAKLELLCFLMRHNKPYRYIINKKQRKTKQN